MESDASVAESKSGSQSPTEGRFALNAVIGAAAAILLGFVPLSPALGGGIAGYLQGGSRGEGLKVGAASGLLAAIPTVLFGGLFALLFIAGGPGGRSFVVFLIFLIAVVLFSAVYVVGLGAVGGWLGIYVRERSKDDPPLVAERASESETGGDGDAVETEA